MQVILIEPVRKLGNIGDIVNVKGGYARNFLIPNKKALRATNENKKLFEARKADIEKENLRRTSAAEKVAKAVEGHFVTLVRQAGEDGRLYGSVSAADIARNLAAQSAQSIERKQVTLNSPIKYIGVYSIPLHVHGSVTTKVNVNVARSESEAADAETRAKRGEKVMEGPDGEEGGKARPVVALPAKEDAEKSGKAETEAAADEGKATKKKAKTKKADSAETVEAKSDEKSTAKAKKVPAKKKAAKSE